MLQSFVGWNGRGSDEILWNTFTYGLLNKKQDDTLLALFGKKSVKVYDISVCAVMESAFKQNALFFIL